MNDYTIAEILEEIRQRQLNKAVATKKKLKEMDALELEQALKHARAIASLRNVNK